MKKALLGALISASLCAACAVVQPVQAYGSLNQLMRSNIAWANDSSSSTVTVLAAQTSVQYTILGILLSVSSADNLTVKCGTRQVLNSIYLGANSGFSNTFTPLSISCNAGEAINITKGTSTTPIGVSVWYSKDNP